MPRNSPEYFSSTFGKDKCCQEVVQNIFISTFGKNKRCQEIVQDISISTLGKINVAKKARNILTSALGNEINIWPCVLYASFDKIC